MPIACLAVMSSAGGAQAQAIAGREIVNIAKVEFLVDGRPGVAESNPARDRVGELLDVAASPLADAPVPAADGERDRAVPFRLTNLGNGRERFTLAVETPPATAEAAGPVCSKVATDTDGDGAYGPADALSTAGAEPALDAGQSLLVFVLCDVPETVNEGQLAAVKLIATALTGAGQPGAVFAGRGDDGVDAVVGGTNGSAAAESALVVALGRPELIKAHSVRDPDGGARVVSGAVVTYTLTARLTGRGVARDVSLDDPVPAGASYVPGSLTLDGVTLSDAADSDPGRFTGDRVQIVLGQLEPSRDRSVQFQVRVN